MKLYNRLIIIITYAALLVIAVAAGAAEAGMILKTAGVKKGNCLVIDTNEKLSLELAGASQLRIYLTTPETKDVKALRRAIAAEKRYGRITCRAEELDNILLPTWFFDLVVVNGIQLDQARFAEAFRLIKPGKQGIFAGAGNVEGLFAGLEVPCIKTTNIEKTDGFSILRKGYEPTNKYLKPPLVRLWVSRAPSRLQNKFSTAYNKGGVDLLNGPAGEVAQTFNMKHVLLDAYTGELIENGPKDGGYRKSEYQADPAPHLYHGVLDGSGGFGQHHGRLEARDLKTGRLDWTFLAHYLLHGCCSEPCYANGVVYKSTYSSLLALDGSSGRLLWQHRNGGNICTGVQAARSILYQPNAHAFRLQAFISDTGWEKRLPKGDVLTQLRNTECGMRNGKTIRNPKSEIRNPNDWPMFRYDVCRTGNSSNAKANPPFKVLWKFDTGGRVRSSPAVAGDTVYVGSSAHRFFALDVRNGKVRWSFFTDDEIHSSPCIADGKVYFGCDDGRVYALDSKSGETVWTYRTATRAPLIPLYGIYEAWVNGRFAAIPVVQWLKTLENDKGMQRAFSPARSFSPFCFNGKPLSTPGVVRSSPVVRNGVLYVGTGLGENADPCFGFLYALDAATGRLIWKKGEKDLSQRPERSFGIDNSPCVYNSTVYFSGGNYTAVETRSGAVVLKGGTVDRGKSFQNVNVGAAPYRTPDGKLKYYVRTQPNYPRPVSTVRGAVSLAVDKHTAFVVSELQLFAVDTDTGKVKWEGRPEENRTWGLAYRSGRRDKWSWGNQNFHQPVAVSGNRVYMGGGRGIAVFDIEKGSSEKAPTTMVGYHRRHPPWPCVKPAAKLSGPEGFVNTAPAIAGGFIFAGADDGCVYAWDLKIGKMIWKHKTGSDVRSSPAISRGRLYIGSDDGYVYCFGN